MSGASKIRKERDQMRMRTARSEVDADGSAIKVGVVQGSQSSLSSILGGVLDEAEATRLAGVTGVDNLGLDDLTVLGEGITERVVGCSPSKTTNKAKQDQNRIESESESKPGRRQIGRKNCPTEDANTKKQEPEAP